MSGGSAHGRDREYQVACRDVLVYRDNELQPYAGDGIDVPFEVGGTTWKLDVALRHPSGRLVVAECRRRKGRVKQGDVAAFIYKVHLLRKDLGVPVEGVFFTKSNHQVGAIKAGQHAHVRLAGLAEGEIPPRFVISFHRYDPERQQRGRDVVVHAPPMGFVLRDSVEVALTHGKVAK